LRQRLSGKRLGKLWLAVRSLRHRLSERQWCCGPNLCRPLLVLFPWWPNNVLIEEAVDAILCSCRRWLAHVVHSPVGRAIWSPIAPHDSHAFLWPDTQPDCRKLCFAPCTRGHIIEIHEDCPGSISAVMMLFELLPRFIPQQHEAFEIFDRHACKGAQFLFDPLQYGGSAWLQHR